MRRWPALFSLLSLMLLGASAAQAQWYRGPGYGGFGWGGGAMTPFQANALGYADVIRAQGEANLNNANAAISAQEAKSRYIDNTVKWTQAYYERKRIFRDERDRELDQQRATRERLRNSRESTAPPRLSSSQIDPSSGRIAWPDSLMGPQYATYRKELDDLYYRRAHAGTSSQTAMQIHQLSRAMQAELKLDIRGMLPNSYLEARKFLDSLAWEGQFPPEA